jgi:hypothetical protein
MKNKQALLNYLFNFLGVILASLADPKQQSFVP